MTEPRCPYSDLPVSMCAHCLGHTAPAPETGHFREVVADCPPFAARYSTYCMAGCDKPIEVEQRIVHVETGGYAHEGCVT